MPELPEVETVRCGLQPVMEGATLARVELRRPDLRFPFPLRFADVLEGRKIVALGRRAKYLLMDMDDGHVVIMHLGMSGRFLTEAGGEIVEPGDFAHESDRKHVHDHVVFHLVQATGEPARVIYNDPRRFGFMALGKRTDLSEHPLLRHLGVEPVGNELSADVLADRLKGRASPLKSALLDQRIIAGLGNIYVCEALFRSGLSPKRASGTLVKKSGAPTAKLERLTQCIRSVIADAIEAGGSSLRDYVHTDGSLGYFQHSFSVYGREGEACFTPDCGRPLKRIVQSGRSTFYCPSCQR